MLRSDLSRCSKARWACVLVAMCSARPASAQNAAPAERPPEAVAERADAARAQVLFEEAKALLAVGDLEAACPKFVKSYELDPDTGALLASASCHRERHQLATAWRELEQGRSRARVEGNAERERYAANALREIAPLLSTVHVEVPPAVAAIAGLELRVDGATLPWGVWNSSVPLDGGRHVLEATAPAREGWRDEFELQPESDSARVAVPMLKEPPPRQESVAENTQPASGSEPLPAQEPESLRWGSLEWAGVATAGAGVLGLGVGAYFFSSALAKSGEESDATVQGNRATVFAITGGVLVAAGATLFLVGRSRSPDASSARLALTLGVPSSGGWAVAVRGAL
jgi:hypothetical protein